MTEKTEGGLASIGLDLVAFAAGLGLAWWFRWQTTDLVWSLWLSSLLVGYAMILTRIFGPVWLIGRSLQSGGASGAGSTVVLGAAVAGGLFLLAFFTFHFGFFHLVHSVFLNSFFPVTAAKSFPSIAVYREVFARYWYFVPVAALAERQAFRLPAAGSATGGSVASGVAPRRRAGLGSGDSMMEPYRNVIRMHLLIFFFAFTHFLHLENFAIYAVVYAVYFFPWRILRRGPAPASAS